jgi:hypothetical protein
MPDLFEPDVELRWRGKETKVKTVSLPFQTVEYIRGDVMGDDHDGGVMRRSLVQETSPDSTSGPDI